MQSCRLDFVLTNCRSQNVSTLTAKTVFAQVKINESPIFLKKKKKEKLCVNNGIAN